MKRISLILILVLFFGSCKKENKDLTHCEIVPVEPALVGRWKLIAWSSGHYNTVTCGHIGGNYYTASDWGTNVVLEVKPEGIFRAYKNDTLVNESFSTKRSINTNGIVRERYDIKCGNMYLAFRSNSSMINSLHDIQIGDTLEIDNPLLDLNFTNNVVLSITWADQYYVKVE